MLLGPTASGKTQLAFELADQLPVDIISIDSAQVFRDMDIGTAKPDTATLARYPHQLIDLITPLESYSAARFCVDARAAMASCVARGRIPLLVGGTMLYYKALTQGLADLPAADPALRAQLEARAAIEGWPALHAELARLDPVTAARLKPMDAQRIQRALEIIHLSGEALSELHARQASSASPLPCRVLPLALVPENRSQLHARIAERFITMLDAGLVTEVVHLRQQYPQLHADLPSMRCVGYRQVWEMLAGQLPAKELAERGIYATRQLAKRQLTWLRSLPDLEAFDPLIPNERKRLVERVKCFIDPAYSQQGGRI